GSIFRPELIPIPHQGVPFILSVHRRPVPNKVLGCSHETAKLSIPNVLQSFDITASERLRHSAISPKCFKSSSPSVIVSDGYGWHKGPIKSTGENIPRRPSGDFFYKFRMMRCAESNVVRKQDCSGDVLIPMYGVRAEEQGCSRRSCIKKLGHIGEF